MRYKQCIHVEGRSVDDIMRLPCVSGCQKTVVDGVFKYTFFPKLMAHPAPLQSAYTGDYLCEQEDGRWVVMNEEQYKQKGL